MNGIPLYARYTSGDPETLKAAVEQNYQDIRHTRELPRNEYPILPWTMDQLPSTSWRNVHTFSLETIQEIREDRYGKPGPDPDPSINAIFSIGLWSNDRFVIVHWVRVDHLPPITQMQWYLAAISHQGTRVAQAQQRLQQQKSHYRKDCVKHTLDQLARATQHAKEFATSHRLPISNLWNFAHLPMFSRSE